MAVYKELLKTHKPENIGIYGTSAGAILTGEVAAALRKQGLPLPAALGIFSGSGDFSKIGDSRAMYALRGLSGALSLPTGKPDTSYTGTTPLNDPVLSPIYANLKGFPADALPHQRTRPAAQQHSQPAQGIRERRRQCAVGSL